MISELDIALRGERAIEWLLSRGATLISVDGEVKIFADLATSATVVIGRVWFSPMSVEVPAASSEKSDLVFISLAMQGTSRLLGQNKRKPLLPRRSSCTTRLNRYSSKRPSLPPA